MRARRRGERPHTAQIPNMTEAILPISPSVAEEKSSPMILTASNTVPDEKPSRGAKSSNRDEAAEVKPFRGEETTEEKLSEGEEAAEEKPSPRVDNVVDLTLTDQEESDDAFGRAGLGTSTSSSDSETEWRPTASLAAPPVYDIRRITHSYRGNGRRLSVVNWVDTEEPASNLPHRMVPAFERRRRALVRRTFIEDEAGGGRSTARRLR
ncbi:hypothetical protein PPTG_15588 [Phytophthora nicotianae INRA-310]|uniref:Uncharacterized protein n=2 Tax=Phytophthora nicotianae TaxID=4792 RepID=W2PSI2_PHYN3|nr:hypothetical protein PPTG_15588 [Phytophthora nicotianae INRA-310]ETN03606.1 hypothetical protein PPTG_15588 [Phytophthora nicotianae INRA-310]